MCRKLLFCLSLLFSLPPLVLRIPHMAFVKGTYEKVRSWGEKKGGVAFVLFPLFLILGRGGEDGHGGKGKKLSSAFPSEEEEEDRGKF